MFSLGCFLVIDFVIKSLNSWLASQILLLPFGICVIHFDYCAFCGRGVVCSAFD